LQQLKNIIHFFDNSNLTEKNRQVGIQDEEGKLEWRLGFHRETKIITNGPPASYPITLMVVGIVKFDKLLPLESKQKHYII